MASAVPGGSVEVDIAIDKIDVVVGGEPVRVVLTNKAMRRLLEQALGQPREVAVRRDQAEAVEPALVHQVHGVDDQRDVRGVLAGGVAALLVLQDRQCLDRPVPACKTGAREVAVDAAHIGLSFAPFFVSLPSAKTLLTSSAVNLAPVHGEWRGQPVNPDNPPALFLIGRRGRPACWSPFANDAGNYNVAVTGKSGSGKSVLRGWRRPGPCTASTSRAPRTRGIDDIEAALIAEAISGAWDEAGSGADLGTVRKNLQSREDRRAKDMATALGPWCPGGAMGRLFAGSAVPDLGNAMTVFELAELKGRGDVQAGRLLPALPLERGPCGDRLGRDRGARRARGRGPADAGSPRAARRRGLGLVPGRMGRLEAAMAARGLGNSADSPRLAERAALMTRAAKRDIDREELRDVWKKQAAGLGLDAPALVGEAAARTLHGVDIPGAEDSLATAKTVAEERETVASMRAGRGRGTAPMRSWVVQGFLNKGPLTAGQKDAVKLILSAEDRVVGVQGYAGSGKTTMLDRARVLAEKKGYRMIGLAPSASAVQTLASEAGIESETLQRFLARNAGVTPMTADHHGRGEGRLDRSSPSRDKTSKSIGFHQLPNLTCPPSGWTRRSSKR